MRKKGDLAAELARRKQKSEQLPAADPVVPIDSLKEIEQVLTPISTPAPPAPKKQSRTSARTHTPAHAPGGITIEDLYRKIMQKKHLSSYTLRFRAEELDDLDAVAKEIEAKANGQISKNDVARAALIWLLDDYHEHGEQSVLAQLVNRL